MTERLKSTQITAAFRDYNQAVEEFRHWRDEIIAAEAVWGKLWVTDMPAFQKKAREMGYIGRNDEWGGPGEWRYATWSEDDVEIDYKGVNFTQHGNVYARGCHVDTVTTGRVIPFVVIDCEMTVEQYVEERGALVLAALRVAQKETEHRRTQMRETRALNKERRDRALLAALQEKYPSGKAPS